MLYIIATPIGNLEDITLRALRILKEVNLILAEDTRRTKKLLLHYQIKTPLISYHQHSRLQKINYILKLLKHGKNLALVSDAGTPGICDPGNKLISLTIEQLNNATIIPIPGPSALTAALSVSGLPCDKFLFLGFPPAKKKRQKFFQEVAGSKHTVIFYESCHRILRTLETLSVILSPKGEESQGQTADGTNALRSFSLAKARLQDDKKDRQIVICRELTKKFETIYRGSIKQVIQQLKNDESNLKGEFVVLVGGS